VNLENLPKGGKLEDYDNWLTAPEDDVSCLKEQFKHYEETEDVLKTNYGVRTLTNDTGIFHYIKSEGVGEGSDYSCQKVLELIQSHLSRPIPIKIGD
jgi:hypothetical protein